MWSTSAGGHLMKVVNLTGFTVYTAFLTHDIISHFYCPRNSLYDILCFAVQIISTFFLKHALQFKFLPRQIRLGICASSFDVTVRTVNKFDAHGAVHRNIISIVKPTRCTNVSNLFILEWHYTGFGWSFRPSSGVKDCTYSNQTDTAVCLLASSQQCLFDICLLLYVQSWTPDDGRNDRPKYIKCLSKIK